MYRSAERTPAFSSRTIYRCNREMCERDSSDKKPSLSLIVTYSHNKTVLVGVRLTPFDL